MPSPAAAPALSLGQRLGHYRIIEKIGAGGMGEVYRALDEHLERVVAIKVLPAGTLTDDSARRRFRQEALALSRFDHPNIATVYDFDSQSGVDFLVTEYVPGCTLADRLSAGPMPEGEIVQLGTQLAEGLVAAHARGVIHRDLKPENLRITPDGRLKILDFGLAVSIPVAGDASTIEDVLGHPPISGTLQFMSPEQLRGETQDARSDIYSAGVVLYEMAAGRSPFNQALTTALVDAVLHRQPFPPSRFRADLSFRLEEIILKCMEKERAHRYQSAVELLTDFRRVASRRTEVEKSIAVLYFENPGGQKDDDYFRDGITEDITTELSKIGNLRVFSRSAVLPYRDKPVAPTQVGKQLAASHVLEGSVRREKDRLRITAQLVEAGSGHCVWAERYDRQMADVFAIQDEIAQNIARALRVVLSDTEKRAVVKVPTADVQAYDFYLRGRQFFHQFRRKGFDFARQMFARAIEMDPSYARAYAGLADCSAFLYMYWESSEPNLAQADDASRKALALDPDLAEAHTSRGLTASLKKDYAEAQREFETAIRLNPNLFEPYYFYGRSWYMQGKLEEAVSWFQQASRVCPEDYQSPMLLASALHGLGRKGEAQTAYRLGFAACRQHLEIHPGDTRAFYMGANALAQLNDRNRSMEWLDRALELEADEPQVLYNVACVYALLGEREKAIECLEKSATKGWRQREWMAHDPDLASLHTDARFCALIEPVLAQEAKTA